MQPKIIIEFDETNLDFLESLMRFMDVSEGQIKFVIDNYKPDYRELIQGFLNKEVTFKELKQAVK